MRTVTEQYNILSQFRDSLEATHAREDRVIENFIDRAEARLEKATAFVEERGIDPENSPLIDRIEDRVEHFEFEATALDARQDAQLAALDERLEALRNDDAFVFEDSVDAPVETPNLNNTDTDTEIVFTQPEDNIA